MLCCRDSGETESYGSDTRGLNNCLCSDAGVLVMQNATDAGSAIESYAGPAAGPVPYIAIPSSTNPYPVPSQHRLAVLTHEPGFEDMSSAL